jgi:putative acetyltransferase
MIGGTHLGKSPQAHSVLAMRIDVDDPARPDVQALLDEHLRDMYTLSPPESVHALDVGKLKTPDVTFWSIRDGDVLLGCGALKEIDAQHGEIKSMRTPASLRRRGAGRSMLQHIIAVGRARGYKRLSLETGSPSAFLPARRLYESFGFSYCEPFGEYKFDPYSVFMTLPLSELEDDL